MRRRTEEKAPTAYATSWADIASKRSGETGKDREVAEGGAQHDIPTEPAAKNYEDVREAHSGEGSLMLQEERELLSVPRLEETCSSESSVTKASAE
jgi:hypothetical protein